MLKEVLDGLNKHQKTLPSKYFYDERGSRLFEAICHLDEYYPTRTEIRIMKDNINEIVNVLGSGIRLIELGSGSSRKTRLLLDHLPHLSTYIPVEISETFLTSVARQLSFEYPSLNIQPVATDYTHPFMLPEGAPPSSGNVAFFPGSTIGNFTPDRAQAFLGLISDLIGESGGLLIGVDLKKDPEILEAAYNDKRGLTAEFNKNLLVRLNRELDANFEIDQFRHRAIYNEEDGRIEMHLVSLKKQWIEIDQNEFLFEKGEYIHTENSYKYSLQDFEELAAPHFHVKNVWTDENNLFSIQYLV